MSPEILKEYVKIDKPLSYYFDAIPITPAFTKIVKICIQENIEPTGYTERHVVQQLISFDDVFICKYALAKYPHYHKIGNRLFLNRLGWIK